MRIRFWAGMHSKNIDAVLVPAKHQPETTEQEEVVIGIIAIAGYNGIDMDIFPQQQTEDGFMDYARYIAGMAERFGIPYMLGERSDADKVRDYWRTKSEEELEKIRGYKFPSQVQKRWHLPPPPPVDEKK
jgi:hypothetical protein